MKKLSLFAFVLFQIAALLAQKIDNNIIPCQESKEDILMQNGTITTCSANFYDSGSSGGNYQNNENYTLTLLPETEGAKIMVTFDTFNCETNYDFLKIYNGASSSSDELVTLTGSTVPNDPIIADNSEGALTFVFTSDASVNKLGWSATVNCFTLHDYNLSAVNILGAPFAAVGVAGEMEVVVKNLGENSVEGSAYNVNIVDENGTILGFSEGETVASFEQISVIVAFTPLSDDALQIKGVVEFSQDQDNSNNETEFMAISVMNSDTHVAQVGTANILPPVRIPFDFYYKNSCVQTIYHPSELGIQGGTLTGLSYHAQFDSDASSGRPIKIWIGETTQTDLLEGWIDPTTLTQVFDGAVSIPYGESTIVIPFSEPYNYNGNTLVIYTYRVFEDNYCCYNGKFYGTEISNSNRTRRFGTDNNFEPSTPGAGTVTNWIPNTTFFFSTVGLGSIEGNVVSQSEPLNNVNIQLVGTMSSVTSNATGFYTFPFLNPGTYSLEFSKLGYQTNSISDIVVASDETTVVDVVFTQISQYMISGTVTASDTNMGLEGATVSLNGYSNYSTVTNSDGTFVFTNVYGEGQEYDLVVEKSGYDFYNEMITVNESHISDINIIINELAYPVTNVVAAINDVDEVNITWDAPQNRSLVNYSVYRLLENQLENDWTLLSNAFSETSFVDDGWITLESGFYQYAVVANYTAGVTSIATLSNVLPHAMTVSYNVNISTNSGDPATGAVVRLVNVDENPEHSYTMISELSGVTFPAVWKGTYNISIEKPGFHNYATTNIVIDNQNLSHSAQLIEEIVQPYNLMLEFQGTSILFSWNNDPGFSDDFESYDDFEYQTIGDYTLVDVDGEATWPITEFNFPNEEYAGSFMVFNPSATNPPASAEWAAHSGTKYLACWASTAMPNNDWLILPQTAITTGMEFSFWARTGDGIWGFDQFKVAVSTTGTNPNDFYFISEPPNVMVPHSWTPYSYDLSSYAGQTVYVAIQCVSNDTNALLIDDIYLGPSKNKSKSFLGYTIYLDGAEVASGLQTTSGLFTDILPISHTFGVKSVYSSGESEVSTIHASISNFLVTFVAKSDVDNSPIPGIEIDINDQTIITNDEGEAYIVLSMGEYDYVLSFNGVDYQTGHVDVYGDNITVNIQGPVAVEEIINDGFSIYPNPVSDLLIINWKNTSPALVEIFSNNGMLIKEFEITEAHVEKSVADFISGVYFIRITNSETTVIQHFIKK